LNKKISNLFNKTSSPEMEIDEIVLNIENSENMIKLIKGIPKYIIINSKNKPIPFRIIFTNIGQSTISCFICLKNRRPSIDKCTFSINKIENRKLYSYNFPYNLQTLGNLNNVFICLKSQENHNIKFKYSFGLVNNTKSRSLDKYNPNLSTYDVPRNIAEIKYQINFLLSNDDEKNMLFEKVREIKRKKKLALHNLSRNKNIILENAYATKSYNQFLEKRDIFNYSQKIKLNDALSFKKSLLEKNLVNRTIFCKRWELRKKQVILIKALLADMALEKIDFIKVINQSWIL